MSISSKNRAGVFRIKDTETGLYYSREYIRTEDPKNPGYGNAQFTHWDHIGSIWTNTGAVQRMFTQITRVEKKNRDTKAKVILYGNKEVARYIIVECDIVDKNEYICNKRKSRSSSKSTGR